MSNEIVVNRGKYHVTVPLTQAAMLYVDPVGVPKPETLGAKEWSVIRGLIVKAFLEEAKDVVFTYSSDTGCVEVQGLA